MVDKELRKMLVAMLVEQNAHAMFDQVVEKFPQKFYGVRPQGFVHSAWQLLEHLRIAQWDILEFSRDPKHKSPKWPDEYWPKAAGPKGPEDWKKSVKSFQSDLADMVKLVKNESNNLFAPFPHGDGQNLLREAMLVMKHNSYHLGQLMMLRKALERSEK